MALATGGDSIGENDSGRLVSLGAVTSGCELEGISIRSANARQNLVDIDSARGINRGKNLSGRPFDKEH